MGLLSHRIERSEMKPGDHIYTYRAIFTYSHHGLSFFLSLFSVQFLFFSCKDLILQCGFFSLRLID